MNSDSENVKKGQKFESIVKEWFENEYNQPFELHKNIKIGYPPKNHSYDISDRAASVVAECKCYEWTETGNVPLEKLANLNEAVLYLFLLQPDTKKYIVLPKSTHIRQKETLAEYYVHRYRHFLNGIKVMEYDIEASEMRLIEKGAVSKS